MALRGPSIYPQGYRSCDTIEAMTETNPFGGFSIAIVEDATPATGGPSTFTSAADRVEAKVVIVGSGPAGLTAAIYAARANLEPIVIAGSAPGGQLMITSDVENYPGFPEGIQGPELMAALRAQAERFGTRIVDVDIDQVDFSARPFRLWARGTEYRAQSVIVATGASALWLGSRARRGCAAAACPPARRATGSSSGTARSRSSAAATPRSRRRPS